MTLPRLKSGLLVKAGLRLCSRKGVPAAVVRRGDPDAGALYVKLNALENGCIVLSQVQVENQRSAWLNATGDTPVSEAEADAYIERQTRYDPDLWVVEIEDRDGRNPFDGALS